MSGPYQDFLGDTFDDPGILTLRGLTIGAQYELQVWSSDSSGAGGVTEFTGPAGSNSVTLDKNTTDVAGGVGQFALAHFTADATSQTVFATASGGGGAFWNGLQLRAIIPEPSTFGLFALGGLGVWRRRRKRSEP